MSIRFASLILFVILTGCASKPAIQDTADPLVGPDGQVIDQPLPQGFEDEYRDGLSLLEDKKYEEALSSWKTLTESYPDFPGVWVNYGLTLYHSGNSAEALAAYVKAIEIDGDFCPVYTLKGVTERNMGQFTEAEQSYQQGIECEPSEGRNYYNLGILLDLYRNDLVGALDAYRKARRLMPDEEVLDIWVIDLARRAEQPEEDPADIEQWYLAIKASKASKQVQELQEATLIGVSESGVASSASEEADQSDSVDTNLESGKAELDSNAVLSDDSEETSVAEELKLNEDVIEPEVGQ